MTLLVHISFSSSSCSVTWSKIDVKHFDRLLNVPEQGYLLTVEKSYHQKSTKITPFTPLDDRQATAARLAIFDHHLERLNLLFPVLSPLISPNYLLLANDAQEDNVFHRLLYDHITTGTAQDIYSKRPCPWSLLRLTYRLHLP
jgi:hypothetical protein